MNELVIIVEGETEQTFVRDQLAAHLVLFGISTWPILPGRKRCHGGVRRWELARQDIVRVLKTPGRYCTTMMDLYALPTDWPGRAEAASLPWDQRASHVEAEISQDIEAAMGRHFNPQWFIPYIQLHEFEALAFSDVAKLASVVAPLSRSTPDQLEKLYQEVLDSAGHPEAINDSYKTYPSRRISDIVDAYRKRTHGPIVTSRIGLPVLREKCNHFASWLDRLEEIGTEV